MGRWKRLNGDGFDQIQRWLKLGATYLMRDGVDDVDARDRPVCGKVVLFEPLLEMGIMSKVRTTGLDLAKNVFQVHGPDAFGAAVFRKQLWRGSCHVIER